MAADASGRSAPKPFAARHQDQNEESIVADESNTKIELESVFSIGSVSPKPPTVPWACASAAECTSAAHPYPWASSIVRDRVSELTVVSAIKRGLVPGEYRTWEERLRFVLATIRDRSGKNIPTFMNAVTPIHFARWFILRPEQYLQYAGPPTQEGKPPQEVPPPYDPDYPEVPNDGLTAPDDEKGHPSWLVVSVYFSGDLGPYIRFLAENVTSELDRIWGHCIGYPERGARDYEAFWLFVRRHQVPTDAFYASYTGMSPARVHQIEVFKDQFDAFVARTRRPDGTSVHDIARLFDEFVQQNIAYTKDFPGAGGLYDEEQQDRFSELKKRPRTP
jgi:hypothetical protein